MLSTGARLGVYEVVAPLGAGGMGEVYRARDTRLGRDVAIKILPETFVDDPDRLARFEREAQLLASLNHPHIAAIYGLEGADASRFIVLELVEGETLDQKLRHGSGPLHRLAVDEALAIARQVADALQAAHDKSIIHRDLKPANIALTHDGQVKVLDFGLARLDPVASGGADAPGGLTHSPTLTFAATQAGIILGTAAYMSPEQAKGRVADKRSDVWAFGCVLFEMLAGKRAFEGEDVTETIAAVIRGEPDWSALPTDVPEQIRLLLKRCLVKDRQARIADISTARFLVTETLAPPVAPVAIGTPARSRSGRALVVTGAALGLLAGIVGTAWLVPAVTNRTADPRRHAARFAFEVLGREGDAIFSNDRDIDISADGSLVVYRLANQAQSQLYVRPIGDLQPRPLTGVTDARHPFFSPDGTWVGFFSSGELKKVPVAGGAAVTVCRVQGSPRGASWGPDDTIVFATADNVGLLSVSAAGGEPMILVKPSEGVLAFPSILPDGKAVLYTVLTNAASAEGVQIGVLDIETGRRAMLMRGGTAPQYAGGFLLFSAGGALRAVRFDLERRAIVGDSIAVVDRVLTSPLGIAANFAVSRTGTLAYIPAGGGSLIAEPRALVWVDRQGQESPVRLPPRAYGDPRLSPDGTRVAVGIRDQQSDIWIGDLARLTLTRLTFDPMLDQAPVWTPDGRRVVWSSQRTGTGLTLFVQSADGTGAAEQVLSATSPLFGTAITIDGAHVVSWENNSRDAQNIVIVDLPRPGAATRGEPQPLIHTNAAELNADISADGHWIAYQSNESGQWEVYVRPFPNVDGGRWQISSAGGTRPLWARSGRELFYLDGNGLLNAAPVRIGSASFEAGVPAVLLRNKYVAGTTGLGLDLRGYDVSPDGQRFLMMKETPRESSSAQPSASIVVVLDWMDELNARFTPQQ